MAERSRHCALLLAAEPALDFLRICTRGGKPEDGSGGDRDDDGKCQHAPADGYVIEARQAFGNKLQQEFPGAKENRETGDAARGNKSTAKCRRGACSLRSVCKAKQAARLEDVNALSYTQVEVK